MNGNNNYPNLTPNFYQQNQTFCESRINGENLELTKDGKIYTFKITDLVNNYNSLKLSNNSLKLFDNLNLPNQQIYKFKINGDFLEITHGSTYSKIKIDDLVNTNLFQSISAKIEKAPVLIGFCSLTFFTWMRSNLMLNSSLIMKQNIKLYTFLASSALIGHELYKWFNGKKKSDSIISLGVGFIIAIPVAEYYKTSSLCWTIY